MKRATPVVVARAGERFRSFAPYVPTLDARRCVTFQASLVGGGAGVFLADGGPVRELLRTGERVIDVVSHPARAANGAFSAYAKTTAGDALALGVDGRLVVATASATGLASIGPLGPTTNEAGVVAFRATTLSGEAGVFTWADGNVSVIAVATGPVRGFEGLPVINERGDVAFRAELVGGEQVIGVADAQGVVWLAETGDDFVELSRFPSINASGQVAFSAITRDGERGVYFARRGARERIFEGTSSFESLRGVLVDDAARVLLIATPRGGALGLYEVDGEKRLAVGDPIEGSSVTEFAANPVSMNGAGDVAARVRLGDGRECIVLCERGR